MKRKLQLTLFGCLSALTSLIAQPLCGFDDLQKKLAEDPFFVNQLKQNEQELQQYIKEKTGKNNVLSTVTIPVVVHVVHTGDAIGTIYNPSDETIQDAIDYLNAVFIGASPETSGSVDMGMQFVLARRSPDCNSTAGIVRIDGSVLPNYVENGVGSGGAEEIAVKNLSRWDRTKYYNIWIVNKIDGKDGTVKPFTAGYAYLPTSFTPASLDGTVILATQMVRGVRTLPHEMGHAFYLYHVFQGDANGCPVNDYCNSDGDRVCDTDPVTTNKDVPRTDINPCTNTQYTSNTEQNLMSYTKERLLFTPGQRARANAALSLASRRALVNSVGSISPTDAPACLSLPVTWLTFEGRKKDKTISLTWSTATEVNNDHFDVETSKNRNVFYKIGQIKGKGTTNHISFYRFTDNAPAEETKYYRLKQVDIDGKIAYSKIIALVFDKTLNRVSIFPNPADNQITVQIEDIKDRAEIQLLSAFGKLVWKQTTGNRTTLMDISALPSGMYILKVKNGIVESTIKIVKH